jgi:excisionase family DNA binding protein
MEESMSRPSDKVPPFRGSRTIARLEDDRVLGRPVTRATSPRGPPADDDDDDDDDAPRTITIERAIARYGFGRSTIYQLIKDKRLRAVKAGARVLIFVDSCEKYLASLPPAKGWGKPAKSA